MKSLLMLLLCASPLLSQDIFENFTYEKTTWVDVENSYNGVVAQAVEDEDASTTSANCLSQAQTETNSPPPWAPAVSEVEAVTETSDPLVAVRHKTWTWFSNVGAPLQWVNSWADARSFLSFHTKPNIGAVATKLQMVFDHTGDDVPADEIASYYVSSSLGCHMTVTWNADQKFHIVVYRKLFDGSTESKTYYRTYAQLPFSINSYHTLTSSNYGWIQAQIYNYQTEFDRVFNGLGWSQTCEHKIYMHFVP